LSSLGATIRVKGLDAAVRGILAASRAMQDLKKPMRDALDYFRHDMIRRAGRGIPPDDSGMSGYPAYTEAYARWKRKRFGGVGWLQLTGEGLSEHNYRRQIKTKTRGVLSYEPRKAWYMLLHQTGWFGTVRRGDSQYEMRIPARPHFGLNRKAVEHATKLVTDYVVTQIERAFANVG